MDTEFLWLLGGRLKAARRLARLNSCDVADDLGLTPERLEGYEAGRDVASALHIRQLATLYHTRVDDLVGLVDPGWVIHGPPEVLGRLTHQAEKARWSLRQQRRTGGASIEQVVAWAVLLDMSVDEFLGCDQDHGRAPADLCSG